MAGIAITLRAMLGAMLISFVYQAGALTSQSIGGAFLVGCFGDSSGRAPNTPLGSTSSMTPQACLQRALAAGYTYENGGYFGVEQGSECWATKDAMQAKFYGMGGDAAPATCNMSCSGDSSLACGGVWAFNLYRITTSSPRYAGCMKDGKARVLPVQLSDSRTTSVQSSEGCRQLARTKNYGWYGLENGHACWAGSSASTAVSLGPLADPPSCQVSCLGNTGEKCGGTLALSMYHSVPADDAVNNPLPLGCVLDENAFKAGGAQSAVYFGFAAGSNYGIAKNIAINSKSRYFAVARKGPNGHSYVFNNTPTNTPQFSYKVGGSKGCFTPCIDDPSKLCGSAKGFNGATVQRVWMVYRMPEVNMCEGVVCSSEVPSSCWTPGTCSNSTGTCSAPTPVPENTPCTLETGPGVCVSGVCTGAATPGVDYDYEYDEMRLPQYLTQEDCDVNCLIGAPCISWCGCAAEKDAQGFYTCIPCTAEQLKACAEAEARERLINLNVARLEAFQARQALEAAEAELNAVLAAAVQQGKDALAEAGKAVAATALAPQPQGCERVVGGGVDGCKQGVRAQVAYCKNKVRSEVDTCKRNQKSAIDACKKKNKLTPFLCEIGRVGIPICEANRINVPLCELDRATSLCCEGARDAARAQCIISGPANVEMLIQSFQVACSVATSVAKSALKSYATGAVMGFVSDIAELQEVVETVQKVKEIKGEVDGMTQATEGIIATAEGNVEAAKSALKGMAAGLGGTDFGQLANDLAGDVVAVIQVAETLPAILEGKLNAALADAVSSVTDSKIVKEGLATIQTLKTKVEAGIKTVEQLKAAVDECRRAQVPSLEQLQNEFGAKIDTVEQVQAFQVKVRERYQQLGKELGKCQQMWLSVQKLAG